MKRLRPLPFFLLGLALAATSLPCFVAAQQPDSPPPSADRRPDRPVADPENQSRMICAGMGFQNGYLEGWSFGEEDRRVNTRQEITTTEAYRSASRGFLDRWGYRVVYQRSYRRGFERGYEDALAGRDNVVVARFADLEERLRDSRDDGDRERGRGTIQTGPIVVPAGASLMLSLEDYLTTRMNQRGDPFSATVNRDVYVGQVLAIPAGTRISGTVGRVVRPGRVSGKAELSLRFEKILLADGRSFDLLATVSGIGPEQGDVADREGTVQGKSSQGRDAKIVAGGAAGGAVIGAVAGGGKGGLIGATIGGLAGLAGVLSTRGEDIELPKGCPVEITLDQDLRLEAPAPPPLPVR